MRLQTFANSRAIDCALTVDNVRAMNDAFGATFP